MLERAFGIDWSRVEYPWSATGTFTRETLRGFVGLGVNRVSLGVQSFTKEFQRAENARVLRFTSIEHVHALLGSGGVAVIVNIAVVKQTRSKRGRWISSAVCQGQRWRYEKVCIGAECEAPQMSTYDCRGREDGVREMVRRRRQVA